MSETLIRAEDLSFYYDYHTPLEKLALDKINLDIPQGQIIALCGRAGSGKSTLIQQLDLLLTPTFGKIQFPGGYVLDMTPKIKRNRTIKPRKKPRIKDWKSIRKDIGVVFQFPEDQLFKRRVIDDVMVGPLNFFKDESLARKMAVEALADIGIDKSFFDRSPFTLSGGEKRKIAIAGVLAFNPKVLILDEPTVGLDRGGARLLIDLIRNRNRKDGTTIILITHDMDLAYAVAERMVILQEGKIVLDSDIVSAFDSGDLIHQAGLLPPRAFVYTRYLISQGLDIDPHLARDPDSLAREIERSVSHV